MSPIANSGGEDFPMATQPAIAINPARLAELSDITLKSGSHRSFEQGACAMEVVSWLAGEPFSDHPACVSPCIGAFMRSWNDALPDADRHILIPLLAKVVGTVNPALEERRGLMAVDWYIRTHTPAWLELAGLTKQAESLRALPEITATAQMPSLRGPLEAVRDDASAAWSAAWSAAESAAESAARSAAWSAAESAAWSAAESAARSAAWSAAWSAARSAAWSAARSAAWSAARIAARSAAWSAARSAAESAARSALAKTTTSLQLSAIDLVERMCALTDQVSA
jgi:hypothetical protein